MAPGAAAAAAAAVVATVLARFAGAATPGSLKAAAAAFANACELMLTTDAPVAGWLRGAPVAARAADRRLAAARGRNNSRVLALARLVLLLREARAVRRRHVLLQWPPTMRPHRHRQIQPRRPRRPRLRGCGHPDRRQPLAQPADLSYREQRLCTTCRMASRRSCWSSRGTHFLPVVRDAHLDTTCKERALWALCGVAYGSRNALERFRAA